MPSIETACHAGVATHRVVRSLTDLHAEPRGASERTSQALFGEAVQVLDERGDWCEVSLLTDAYRGFVRRADLVPGVEPATHLVAVRQSLRFDRPDIKSPNAIPVHVQSRLTVVDHSDCRRFLRDPDGNWFWRAHCREIGFRFESDATTLAIELFSGTPYLWGGRSPAGCDCSALVQLVAACLGFALPRDSGDQERRLDRRVEFDSRMAGDLVFWRGHVAWLLDRERVVHLTAHTLAFAIEPLAAVIERAGPPTSLARPNRDGRSFVGGTRGSTSDH